MVTTGEYYKLLELPCDASDDDIRKAYRKAAMRWHPDKNPEAEQYAERKFKEITEAYEVLSDKSKRDLYDRYGKDGLTGAADEGAPGHIFNFASIRDIFREFFWGREPFYDVPDDERSNTGAAGAESQDGGNDVSEVGRNESQEDYELHGAGNASHYEYESVPACESHEQYAPYDGWSWPQDRAGTTPACESHEQYALYDGWSWPQDRAGTTPACESHEQYAPYDGWSWPQDRPGITPACESHEQYALYDGWSWPQDRDESAPVYEPHAAWSNRQERPGYVLYDEWIGMQDGPESARVCEVPARWHKLNAGRSKAAEWKQATAGYEPAPGHAAPYEWSKSAASCAKGADRSNELAPEWNQPVAAGKSRPPSETRVLPYGGSLLSGRSKRRQSEGMEKLLSGMRKLLGGTRKLLCRRSELQGGASPVAGEPGVFSKGASGLHGASWLPDITHWPQGETTQLQGRARQLLRLPDVSAGLQDETSQLTDITDRPLSARSSLRHGTSQCPDGIGRPPGGMSRLPDITSHLLSRTSGVPGRRHLGVQSSESSCSHSSFIARLGRML